MELPDYITTQIPRWSATGQLSRTRRLIILMVCCQAVLMIGIDNTIVNVALPSIGRDLHAPVSGLQWTVSAYTIMLGAFMLLAGSLGDRFGRRAVFQTGLAMFTLGSWLCSVAPTLAWLIAFRAVQGMGGSMLNPVAASIIASTFTGKAERARAMGMFSAVLGVGMALGPVAGGFLTHAAGWRGTFWVNIPVGLASVMLAAVGIPESRAVRPPRLDPAGQALVIAFLGALTYVIIEAPGTGWHAPRIEGAASVAIAALAILLRFEARRRQPLIDTRFFASVPFSGAIATSIAAFTALGGFLFLATLYFQDVLGLSPVRAGLRILPTAIGMAVCSPVAGRIMAARGPRIPLVAGGVCMTLGIAALGPFIGLSQEGYLALAFELFGIGVGLVNPVITTLAVSGMPPSHAGVAAGISSGSRQVGQSLGVAIAGSILAAGTRGALAPGEFTRASGEFTRASQGAWWVLAGCGYLVLMLGFLTTTRRAARSARAAALMFGPRPAPRYQARSVPARRPGRG